VRLLRGELFSFLSDLLSRNFSVLRPGKMVLVLSSPGPGCITFLKVIANDRGARPPEASGSPVSGVFGASVGGRVGRRPARRSSRVCGWVY